VLTWQRFGLFLLLPVLVAGCSSGRPVENSGRAGELRDVAVLLALASGPGNKAPTRFADLVKHENGGPTGFQAVKAGEIVVVWGVPMPPEGQPGGTTDIIAYEKKTPTEGGLVLLHNGTIQEMTAEAFAAAPRAK
jgi:hypothetical protein